MIPILDLRAQYASLKNEIDAAVLDVFAGGAYINGSNVRAFEAELAAYVGTSEAIGVNSGTDALHLALRALDVGPGDEVITSPFTFVATSEAIGIVGARPVFVDIDSRTFGITPEAIEAAITARTKVILPVHLYGTPCAMLEIMQLARRRGIEVVEDCAQAIGAQSSGRNVGTFGAFGCFSFFPSKNLGAFGDGGMLTTDRAQLADRVRALRAHGGRVRYFHEELGLNSRLDEVQAAILRVKLRQLDRWNRARRSIAARYDEAFHGLDGVVVPLQPAGSTGVYHQYTLQVIERDAVQSRLARAGVQTMVYYPVALHLQKVHALLGYAPGTFPVAEAAAGRVISLPMYPELTIADQERVIAAVRAALAKDVA